MPLTAQPRQQGIGLDSAPGSPFAPAAPVPPAAAPSPFSPAPEGQAPAAPAPAPVPVAAAPAPAPIPVTPAPAPIPVTPAPAPAPVAPAPAPVAPAPAPTAPAPASSGEKVEVGLKNILRSIPAADLGFDANQVPDWVKASLPVSQVTPQIASGKVEFPLEQIVSSIDQNFKPAFAKASPGITVKVPFQEVFDALPKGSIPKPATPSVFETPFSEKAAEDSGKSPSSPFEEVDDKDPAADAASSPFSTVPGGAGAIAAGVGAVGAAGAVAASASPFSGIEPEAKPADPDPASPFAEATTPESPSAPPQASPFAAADSESTTETPPATSPFAPLEEEPPADSVLSALPESKDPEPSAPSPFPDIEPLAAKDETPEPVEEKEPEPAQASAIPVLPTIPEHEDPQPLESLSVSPSSPEKALTSEDFGAEAPEVPKTPVEGPPRDLGLGYIDDRSQMVIRALFETQDRLTLQDIADRSAGLGGISASVIMTKDSTVKSGGDDETHFTNAAESMYSHVQGLAGEMGISDAAYFSLRNEKDIMSFFTEGSTCMAVLHAEPAFQIGVHEKLSLITRELSEAP